MARKCITAAQAAELVGQNDTVVIHGSGGVLVPDTILKAVEARYLETQAPGNLKLVVPIIPGTRAEMNGMNRFAHKGMLREIMGTCFDPIRHPELIRMINDGEIEGYEASIGTIVHLCRAIGSNQPGHFTRAGLGSYLDPRDQGGRMNDRSDNLPVRVEEVAGQEYLFYPSFPIDVAIIRGSTADEAGNISFEDDPNTLGAVEYALAARASGGKVIVQVKRLARSGSLDPHKVRVPAALVDHIVVEPFQQQISGFKQDPLAGVDPFLNGQLRMPLDGLPPIPQTPMRMVLRRAALEMKRGQSINLGQGMPTNLPRVALEEGVLDDLSFNNEHGAFGGLTAEGYVGNFLPAVNVEAIMDSSFTFNYYDGGCLDMTYLGFGEVDQYGNINVNRFGKLWNGSGGFTNIVEKTPQVVFCGTLTAGGLQTEFVDGELKIVVEGRNKRFVPKVSHICFNGSRAHAKGQKALYITERAVFELGPNGIELIEVAPGIDIEMQIKPFVDFDLQVSEHLKLMPMDVFKDVPLNLSHRFEKTEAA
ncbi:CoA-transferase [Cognatishimia activa]|uniref:CoA-transferase n=1 Tax=Cognatishimia activa TaxID=1715691 RepID=UPI0022316492|nr:CoA-transferase [Cognatishimia activa]UZD91277.1 acyl CoA:acetate/3-ketoacid CoA transferase [Cognatishimia activa]